MSFSNYGLLQLTLLLFLFSQGCPQCYKARHRSIGHVRPACCTETSNATIKGSVNECFEQTAQRFHHCRVDAYIFTKQKKTWCVDPRAPWLQKRFQRLERRGICCQIM